jgi:vacuolar-type H+-ATPase subunit H
MAHTCNIDNLYGAIQARATIDQGPIFKTGNIEKAVLDSQLSYASIMNNNASKQADVNIAKTVHSEGVKSVVNQGINLGRTAEALVPQKAYARIDKQMEAFNTVYKKQFLPKINAVERKYAPQLKQAKGKDQVQAIQAKKNKELAPIRAEAEKLYKEQVASRFTEGKEQIQTVFNKADGNIKKLDARLKAMGLTREGAYYTHEYLKYLENGGPFFNFNPGSGSKLQWINERISTITGKKVSFNPMTAVYNVGELAQKAPAAFGFKHTANGIADAVQAAQQAKVTIFDKIPALEKAGIYSSDHSALRPESNFDPVSKTQNMLDNAAFFIGKRAGNVDKAFKEIAYRPKPWNDTFIYNDPSNKNLLNFMSFQFRHMQQYGGWARDIISNEGGRRVQSAKALATYAAMSGVLFGDKAVIPAPIYYLLKGVDKELDAHIEQFGPFKKGLVGLATGGNLDLGKTAQPLGGIALGVGADMVSDAIDAGKNTIPKTLKQAQAGHPDKAIAAAVDGLAKFSQLFSNGANAATQKAIAGATKAYIDDKFNVEDLTREIGKKYFGKDAIPKKAN